METRMTRKEFLGGAAAFAAVPAFAKTPGEIRGVLLHMGMNMWGEWRAPGEPKLEGKRYCPGYYNEDVQGYVIEKMKPCYQPRLKIFIELGRAGFDLVALPTNWVSEKLKASGRKDNADNSAEIVKFCRANIAPERLKGFMMASWTDCQGEWAFKFNCAGMDQLSAAVERNSGKYFQ